MLTVFNFFSIRGHTVRAVSESFHLSKDAGFKVSCFQLQDSLRTVPTNTEVFLCGL